MNSVVIVGRLARDPSLKELSNTSVCNLTVAVDRPYTKGENKADFLSVKVFGKQAENCSQFLSKGRQVAVQGRIQTDTFTKKDGSKGYSTDIIADRVEFIGGSGQAEKPSPYQGFHEYSDDDEDIPF